MLRPMVATTAVTAALILLAGCGGEKKSGSGSDSNGSQSNTSASPTAPSIPTFDPPKGFAVGAAYPVIKDPTEYTLRHADLALVGKVAVVSNKKTLSGHDVTDPSKTWSMQVTPATTTTVNAVRPPQAVKVDGKDAAVVVYSETDKGNGTQKPQGLAVVRWVDVATGDKIAETTTKLAFDDAQAGTPAYDVETGQVVFSVEGPNSPSGDSTFGTVFADPATKKSTFIAGMTPAAVRGGVIAGSTAPTSTNANDAVLTLADGPSGKITKKFGSKQTSYTSIAGTGKHGYFYGMKYVNYDTGYELGLYAVDLSTGAVTATPLPRIQSSTQGGGWSCLWDQATSVVCTGTTGVNSNRTDTIVGFDDATGKKAWGFSNDSGNRNVPDLTTAYHGVLYAKTEAQPVLLDAKTGADLPSASPSSTDSPSTGTTPSDSASPTAGDTPSDGSTPGDGASSGNGDLALFDGTLQSPTSVSPYGGVYSQQPKGDYSVTDQLDSVCVFMKATA